MKGKELRAIVSIGSNDGNIEEHILSAYNSLLKMENCYDFNFSHIYKTKSVGYPGGSDFLNAASSFTTTLSPAVLLKYLLAIEQENGRVRTEKNAPRTLDLDLILCGSRILNTRNLTLPHPRCHERFFVLVPLCDIEPKVVHPVLNKSMIDLLSGLSKKEMPSAYVRLYRESFKTLSC